MAYKLFILHIVTSTYAIVLARASRISALAPKFSCSAQFVSHPTWGPY